MSQLSLLRGLSSLSRAVCPTGIDKVFLILVLSEGGETQAFKENYIYSEKPTGQIQYQVTLLGRVDGW